MMFGNYLKIALHNLYRHQLLAIVNILGLAVGLASCLLIALFVRYELSFDHQYRNAERIVRIDQVVAGLPNFRTPGLLADALVTEMQEVEQAARFVNVATTLTYEDQAFNESAFAYADAQFLEIFDFHWLQGTPQQALTNPSSVVLTKTLATKFFGTADPIGKVLSAGESSLRVTGVIADLPDNTHLRFSALASMATFAKGLSEIGFELDSWNSWFVTTYVLLDEAASVPDFRAQLPQLAARHMPTRISLEMLPLTDVYMQAQAPMELSPVGSMQRVLIFSAIAVCILIIAIINFVNLTTSRASWRAVEVGLRKSIGASRAQLIAQFLGESIAQVFCAMLLGLMLVELLLPTVSTVTGKALDVDIWTNAAVIAGLLSCTVTLGIVAGCYPAFYLSAFRPVAALKGELTRGRSASLLRGLLVVVQFSISIALIVATSVIYLQIRHVRNIDMGFDDQQVVLLDAPSVDIFDANTQWESLRARLNDHPGVIDSTHSAASPLKPGSKTSAFIYREQNGARVQSEDRFMLESVEPHYLATYGLQLLSGRWFSNTLQSDRLATFQPGYQGTPRGSLVLNEEAARRLGWSPAEALGQVVGVGTIQRGTVAGVVGNTLASPRQQYQPLIYFVPEAFDYRFGATLAVRIAGDHAPQVLDHIDATWKAFFPDAPVQRYFLEDQVDALYQAETRQMQLSALSALVAVLLACSGLYALAAFNAEHRIKEIGVRKVMGGSVWSIVLLLTNDFSKLVLLANLIAWPIAYFAMERWLQNFAYRIDLTPLIFIGSGLIALCIAWVTVGGTAAKAASQKPILTLRYE